MRSTSPSTAAWSLRACGVAGATSPSGTGRAMAEGERMLVRPRLALGAVAVVLALLVPPEGRADLVAAGLWLAATSAASIWLAHPSLPHGARRTGRRSPLTWIHATSPTLALTSDVLVAGFLFTTLGSGPYFPVAFVLPLLAFELTLKLGRRGTVTAAVATVVALAAKATFRFASYGLTPRYDLALLVMTGAAAFLGVGISLRSREQQRLGAVLEKEQIAASLRATVMELLAAAGKDADVWEGAQLSSLLDAACQTPDVAPELAAHLARQLSDQADPFKPSPRETEVLALLETGMTDRQIAEQLFLSPGTVRVHISNASRKLRASNRAEAVEAYRRLTAKRPR